MSDIKNIRNDEIPIILWGNKYDLEDQRQISKKEGEDLEKKYNVIFYETSTIERTNIENAFFELINQIIEKNEKKEKIIKNSYHIIEKDIENNNIVNNLEKEVLNKNIVNNKQNKKE